MTRSKPELTPDEEELTEITKMHAPRVDLVHGPANGIGFLLAKSADDADPSIFTEDDVAALAKRAQEGDTMTDITAPDEADLEKAVEAPTVDASGDPTDPGSPAWEAVDAALAQEAIDLTVALRRLVEASAKRETQEALLGDDPDDAEAAWSLESVLDAIDCILGVLAPYQVQEAAEAEEREDDDDTLILKSGRVLSGVNEDRVRQAHTLLTDVLAALPTTEVLEETADTIEEPTEDLEKAEEQILVYTRTGKVLGSIKPTALTTFAADPDDTEADEAPEDPAEEAAETPDEEAAEEATEPVEAATDTPTTPDDAGQPTADEMNADARTIPGTDTVQSPVDTTEDVKKGQLTPETLEIALQEALAPLTKALEQRDEAIVLLKSRLDAFGKQPDDRNSPTRNGALGVTEAVRGDVQAVDDPLQKALEETDPAARQTAAYDLIRARFQQ